MKIIKKIISTAMASILLLLSFSLPVQASGYYDYTSSNIAFSTAKTYIKN